MMDFGVQAKSRENSGNKENDSTSLGRGNWVISELNNRTLKYQGRGGLQTKEKNSRFPKRDTGRKKETERRSNLNHEERKITKGRPPLAD